MDIPLRLFDDMTFLGKVGDVVFMLFAYPCVVIYLFWYGDGSSPRSGEAARREKNHEKAIKAAMKERKKNEPPELPPHTQHVSANPQRKDLGFQLFKHLDQTKHHSRPEILSSLLRLPLEIREQIYFEVLGQDTIHIVQLPKRLGHRRCLSSIITRTHNNIICNRECFDSSTPIQTYRHGEFMNMKATSENSLGLLRTCRQVYNEASHILYESNTFDINHPQTLLFLARTIPPSRFASIKYLNLTWSGVLPFIIKDITQAPDDLETWEETWKIIGGKMPDLRVLNLRMLIYDDEVEKSRSGPFLQHARKRWTTNGVQFEKILTNMKENVRGLRDFHMGVELPEDVEWDVGELEGRLREAVCSPRKIAGS